MKRVLITGGTGYVGDEVVRHFLGRGDAVTMLGRTKPGAGTPFIKADVADRRSLEKGLAGRSFDAVVHLASLPGDTGDPHQMTATNVTGCLNILEAARAMKVGRFVLASSISAYEWYPATKFSPPDSMPVDEEHPCRPKDIYATSKRMQELLLLTYVHQYKLSAAALRLTAVVGPRGKGGGRGWREFAEGLAGGKKVQIPHFSAEELCHYVDVRDVARMFAAAVDHPNVGGEIFNCCAPGPTRGAEFAGIVRGLVPGIEVAYGFPWSMAQGGEISFSMEKARRVMGFVPQFTLADAVASIKAWVDAGGLQEGLGRKERFGSGVKKE